jgi:2-polyprenyl-3-methyl-5-hydroxy-6-metoxy-1,4-benzoquinol methylase
MQVSAVRGFDLLSKAVAEHAPLFYKNSKKVEAMFGKEWVHDLDEHLERLFGFNEAAYRQAVHGYAKFSLSAMRLQTLFNKAHRYEEQSYSDACQNVYQNRDFMNEVYLPGIFVSQFLWQHHYRQIQFYRECFLPLLQGAKNRRFYDVGTGTGFYSVQALQRLNGFHGYGIDTSPYAREFTMRHVDAWGFGSDVYTTMDVDIIEADLEPAPCVQSIEVLEHLSDPELFLRSLRKMLQPGGYGFVAAAITAPEDDHIYLYWTPEDVIRQLNNAGFEVLAYREEAGYEGRPGELVPKVAAFIVR